MAQSQSIPPFPENIDRRHFASWLSGFVDGEGSFSLRLYKKYPVARLYIGLRDDDAPILDLVRRFWQCGRLCFHSLVKSKVGSKPTAGLSVNRVPDLANIIVPHFDAFPLFAKKSRDFAIWKQAILLMVEAQKRRHGGRNCTWKQWDKPALEHFRQLADTLVAQRKYQTPTLKIPTRKHVPHPTLFDGLAE